MDVCLDPPFCLSKKKNLPVTVHPLLYERFMFKPFAIYHSAFDLPTISISNNAHGSYNIEISVRGDVCDAYYALYVRNQRHSNSAPYIKEP